ALLLKEDVTHAQCLIDDQYVRLHRDRDGESHPHHHSGRVRLDRLLDEGSDVGETGNLIELLRHLTAADPEDGTGKIDILAPGKLRVETGAEFQQGGDAPVH